MKAYDETAKERLLAKTLKKEACLLWTGGKTEKGGYGRIYYRGRMVSAHRLAYQLFVGEITDNLQVLHQGDTPSCIAPGHLFLGTNGDNIRDSIQKGLRKFRCKLSEADVVAIRRLATEGTTQKELAVAYGVTQQAISDIVRRKKWRRV